MKERTCLPGAIESFFEIKNVLYEGSKGLHISSYGRRSEVLGAILDNNPHL